ncbi:uncharacterized protein DSM5745_10863 [Aspergillus mulundensis]|uniref:Uncharacterized protein n=1 Tax=Aspergillus mulundensis TaxID=1810919 RepID=A0A3D8QF06_9EURO|nr:hypothetical protein DSM5745_10863 [Aspergillus mulundensis]RDW60405.1 hypothetical protein DSM5745_10863 [Aspergillus mulundensis]
MPIVPTESNIAITPKNVSVCRCAEYSYAVAARYIPVIVYMKNARTAWCLMPGHRGARDEEEASCRNERRNLISIVSICEAWPRLA